MKQIFKPNCVMIDLETLDITPDAHILSIGACTMDEANTFYSTVNVQDRSISVDTVAWWAKQNKEAQKIFNDCAEADRNLEDVLRAFKTWLYEIKPTTIWSHGATFDVVILDNAFRQYGIETPWKYWSCRDTRTLIGVSEAIMGDAFKPHRVGVHHNALDDALFQAKWMWNIQEFLTRS